jgi:hypothetical protein
MVRKSIVLILTFLWSVPALAEHPMITDDTGTQGKGKFLLELNTGFSIEKIEANGGMVGALTWGIADNVDLGVAPPFQWAPAKGIGDITAEVKWRIFEAEQSGLSLALKPGFSIPTGDEKKGLGNGAFSGGVMVIVTKEAKQGDLHCNVGYTRNAYGMKSDADLSRLDIWHASAAAEIHIMEKLRSVVDIGIDTNPDKTSNTHPVYLIGGLIYSVTDDFDLDVGVKGGLNHVITDTMFLAGLTVNM